ncbi:MAG: response regulator transcription factor [Firmicutes bacterium]|nr:response regulator transcription factor [Alicyclobacillaceae bacterium]MCL6497682.1 response regulator transcription factor [Bacillota bacterium]
MPARILVVDDDKHIRELCRIYLEASGFRVLEAADGQAALAQVAAERPDLLVLDVMLPKLDGWQVLNEVRKDSIWLPVVMLTAVGDEEDRVLGLDLGADDYLTKPFSPKELVARVRAVLRRAAFAAGGEGQEVLRFGELVIDPGSRKVFCGSERLNLTPREFELLWFLASHPQQVFSRDQLLDKVWGFDFEGDARTVDVHITRIRHKLAENHGPHYYLETVWGQGYRFNPGLHANNHARLD